MIALTWDPTRAVLDLALDEDGSLAIDEGFNSAVLLSLLTDRRAPPGSGREGQQARGYWADAFEADAWGSLLWLLRYEPLVEREVGARLRAYVEQALGWLRKAGVVKTIAVTTTVLSRDAIGVTIVLEGAEGAWSMQWKWTKGALHAA